MSSFSNVDPDEEWYYLNDQTNEQQGPYPFGEFKNFYRLKKFTSFSYVWNPNFHENWIELNTDDKLLKRLKEAPRLTTMGPAAVRKTRMGKVSISVSTPAGAPPHSQSFSLNRVKSSSSNISSFDSRTNKERTLLNSIGELTIDSNEDNGKKKTKKKKKMILEDEEDTPLTDAERNALDASSWKVLKTLDGEVEYYCNEATNQITYEKPDILLSLKERRKDNTKWVWYPDKKEGYVPATFIRTKPDGRTEVSLNGRTKTLKRSQKVMPLDIKSLTRLKPDLVHLDSLNEGLILHNLKERYQVEQIYTNIGTILVSINPYKRLPLYTFEQIHRYSRKGTRELPPHVYSIADRAYKALVLEGLDQSILISGESGAGKTEATKQCLNFIAEIAGSASNIEQKILNTNPILEAFGNAKTLRNDNSSRFGRFTEVFFNNAGQISGAAIKNYLLEKSRVPFQQEGERNYHVFYQLLASDLAKDFGLEDGADCFYYAAQSGCTEVLGIDDAFEHEDCYNALEQIGMTKEQIHWVYSLVAVVLHIGNIIFASDGDQGSVIKSEKALELTAKTLGVSADKLKASLLTREVVINNEHMILPMRPLDAKQGAGALAKAIYGNLFDWLVNRINLALQGGSGSFIGILDIFGFEVFEKNLFEQLCINFTNEKLQRLFNNHTFNEEEAFYKSEGVDFEHVSYIDNKPIIDLLEGRRPPGILLIADDEIKTPGHNDQRFVGKIDRIHKKNPNYIDVSHSLKGKSSFSIKHYAGPVSYDATGFLAKNKDLLRKDLYNLISTEGLEQTKELFPTIDTSSRKKYSLGSKFRKQLRQLMNLLEGTEPNYIRCIKPNDVKAACGEKGCCDAKMVLEQLRCSGVFEACQIRKAGFPFRKQYGKFVEQFKCLKLSADGVWTKFNAPKSNAKAQAEEILEYTKQDFSAIQRGKTSFLYKSKEHKLLGLLKNLALERVAARIQAAARGYIVRTGYLPKIKRALPLLREALKDPTIEKLDSAMAEASRIMGEYAIMGGNFEDSAILKVCRRLRSSLVEWNRLAALFKQALEMDLSKDEHFEFLFSVVSQAERIDDLIPTDAHEKQYNEALSLFKKWRADKLVTMIDSAMVDMERNILRSVFIECSRLHFTEDKRLPEIQELLGISDEELLKRQYKRAVQLNNETRAIDREIKLKEFYLGMHGGIMSWQQFPQLRQPAEFAAAKFLPIGRADVAAGMLRHTKSLLPTSLTRLGDCKKQDGTPVQAKEMVKHATRSFKALLCWMGDRKSSHPKELVVEILTKGVDYPTLRSEIFLQIMKQLTNNPTQSSIVRGWNLLVLCLKTFKPLPSFENYLHVFIRKATTITYQDKVSLCASIYERVYKGDREVAPDPDDLEDIIELKHTIDEVYTQHIEI